MYSDAVKVVGADFEVAELTALIERALAEAEPPSGSAEQVRQLVDDVEQVGDRPVVGDVEDRRAGIRVDGDDQLRRPASPRRARAHPRPRARGRAWASPSPPTCRSAAPSGPSRNR